METIVGLEINETARYVMETASHLMDFDEEKLTEIQEANNTSVRLLNLIDDVAQNVSLDLTSSTFSWAFSNLKLLVVGVDPKTKAASPENQTQGFLSSSWTKFRREWSTVGTLSSKDSCASARAGHAPVIEEIDKCASVLDEESRAYLQYVVTVPRTDSTKIEAFVKKVGRSLCT
ncbi:uncharacterized protein [Oscarella lobularis]|uniref:uncharacterized protein n=1 Tax=Oscarella lobularis TaxID=121494 RepID=UPI0033138110